jgi:thioredoxin reductase
MGLIRNAFEQGRQCIEAIPRANGGPAGDVKDLLIVGSGPAGLSASLHAARLGLDFVTVEREEQIGGTVRHYPRKKLVLTEAVKIPGYGRIGSREILKEELIEIWEDIAATTGLQVNTGETVASVTPDADGAFSVVTTKGSYRARRVILAIGRRGVPRRLGIPGEQLPKVAYSLREPEHFSDDQVLVVGGGDSAIEAALTLAEQPGNDVKISYRKDRFSRIKPRNLERIEAGISGGVVQPLWSTNLVAIEPDRVAFTNGSSGPQTIPNDQVFVFIGGELPTKFLDSCGVAIDTKFGQP